MARARHLGDLGESYRLRQDVVGLIADRLPITLELVVMSMLIAIAIAIPLGIAQAHRRDSLFDYVGSLFALVGLSLAGVLRRDAGRPDLRRVAPLAAGVRLGRRHPRPVRHLLLPACALALGTIALTSRMTR